MKKIILAITTLLVTTLLTSASALAAPSGFYIDPSTGTVAKDVSFSVQLRLNAGSNSGIQANLEFDPTKLQVQSSSNQGSALDDVTVTRDNSAGRISVYSVSGSDSGDRLITTLTFRATNPGTAPLNFVGNNSTLRYALLLPIWTSVATTNASYSITAPSGTTTPGGSTPATPSNPGNITSPRNSTSPRTTTPGTTPPSSASEPDTSAQPTVTPEGNPETTGSQFNAAPEFKTTPPDTEPWESYTATVPTSVLLVPWLPIITVASALVVIGGTYAAYRQTHMSQSLRRLLATIAAGNVTPAGSTAPKLLTGTILPTLKLLAYTQPKLLASGIKQKLLGTGKDPQDKN